MSTEMNIAGHNDQTPQEYHKVFDLPIPVPKLVHSFRLACDLEPVRSLGEGVGGDGGQFNWVSFTGGHVSSTLFTATILSGQDSQHLLPSSHPSAPLSARVDTRYLLQTSDGVYIEVRTRGWRTGKKDVLERLSNAAREEGGKDSVPGPEEYKFRLSVEMETDSRNEKYAWLNQALWIGSGMRSGRQVVYDAYLVE